MANITNRRVDLDSEQTCPHCGDSFEISEVDTDTYHPHYAPGYSGYVACPKCGEDIKMNYFGRSEKERKQAYEAMEG